MIPKLSEVSPVQAKYLAFIERLKASGFSGDTNPDYANRVVLATDNSILPSITTRGNLPQEHRRYSAINAPCQ